MSEKIDFVDIEELDTKDHLDGTEYIQVGPHQKINLREQIQRTLENNHKHIVLNYDIDAESLVTGGTYMATLTNNNYTELVSDTVNDTDSVIDAVITLRGTQKSHAVRVTKVSTFGPNSAPLGVELWGEYRLLSFTSNQGKEMNNGGLQRIIINQNLNDNTATISVGEIVPNGNVFALVYTFIGSSWDDENATLSPTMECKDVYSWVKVNVINQGVVVKISPAYSNVRGSFVTDELYLGGTSIILIGRIWIDDKKKWIKLTITHNDDHTVTFTKEYEEVNGYVFRATADPGTLALTFPSPEEDYYEENAAVCDKLWALYSSSWDEFNRVTISIVAKFSGEEGGLVFPIDTRFIQSPDNMAMVFCGSLFNVSQQRYTMLTCSWKETDSVWSFRAGLSVTSEFPILDDRRKIQDANLRTPLYSLVCTSPDNTSITLNPSFEKANMETLAMMYLMQDNLNVRLDGNVELIVNFSGANERYRGFLSYYSRGRIWVGNITNMSFDGNEGYIQGYSFRISVEKTDSETYTISSTANPFQLPTSANILSHYISTSSAQTFSLTNQARARSNMGIHQIVLQNGETTNEGFMTATDASGYLNSNKVAYKRMAEAFRNNTNELFIVTLFIDRSFSVSGLVRAANAELWQGLLLDSANAAPPWDTLQTAIRFFSIWVDVVVIADSVNSNDYSGIRWRYNTIQLPEYTGLLNEITLIKSKIDELTGKK